MEEKTNYDILFIGGVYEENSEEEYLKKSKNGIQNAVNTHQWNFIKGLDENNITPVKILSARYVEAYPNYRDIYVKRRIWNHKNDSQDENIGFINIKVLKNIVRKSKLIRKAKQWASKKEKRDKVIICYYPSIPQMEATIKAKEKNKKIKTILIIPDIPAFMNLQSNQSKIKDKLSKVVEARQKKLIKMFDGYVLLTEYMANALEIDDKMKIVIEGIVNKEDRNYAKKKTEEKSIVYSGSLHKKYGIGNYLEAIKLIENKNINFYIFGSGEMQEEIIQLAKKDNRIKFMGYKTREEVLKYQRKATILINPRNINEEYVKYSFPSKLIEYMLSGTPVLTTKLPCIPEEYFPYLFFIDGDATPENLKKAIEDVLSLEKEILDEKGDKAKNFIIENKNYIVQTKKIIELIKQLM